MCCRVCLGSKGSEEGPHSYWAGGDCRLASDMVRGLGRPALASGVDLGEGELLSQLIPLLAGSAAPAGTWDSRPWPLHIPGVQTAPL